MSADSEPVVLVASSQLEIRRRRLPNASCYIFDGSCATMSDSVRGSIPGIYDDAVEQNTNLILDVSKLEFAHSTMIAIWLTLVGWATEQGHRVGRGHLEIQRVEHGLPFIGIGVRLAQVTDGKHGPRLTYFFTKR